MNIVVVGGTGFIGKQLVSRLSSEGHLVVLLTRNPEQRSPVANIKIVQWDGRNSGAWTEHIGASYAVVNLAGESIGAKRWSPSRKAGIIESRIYATRAIVAAIRSSAKKPAVLINASAVGYYGPIPEGDVAEDMRKGNGFLADVCAKWEQEARVAEEGGIRVVITRFGVVLGKNGGALERMMLPFKLFAGGPIGSGRQWFPWVHIDDVVGAIMFALKTPALSGAVNVAAPEGVRMKEFCASLGKAMSRPSWAPVPAFVLKVVLGELSSMVLTGQKVVPRKLQSAGYAFQFSTLEAALRNVVNKG